MHGLFGSSAVWLDNEKTDESDSI
ncbi:hypothetical protein A3Q56_06985, partial [Intoshia linei]